MPKRSYVGAVIGFVVGALIAFYFAGDVPETTILRGLQLACALFGAAGGLATGVANKAGNGRDKVVAAGARWLPPDRHDDLAVSLDVLTEVRTAPALLTVGRSRRFA